MSNFSELIKSLKSIRWYMKDFYIYGFKTRNDFPSEKRRTYDNEKRRIESWLGDLVQSYDTSRGRQVSISADCGKIYTNPLYRAYQSKSFTNNDVRLHFYILDILKDGSKLSVNEITNIICFRYSIFDIQTVRIKLDEYVNLGILYKEKFGKVNLYAVYPTMDFIYNQEFQTALKYSTMAYPFGVVGYYLLNQLDIQNDIFLMKHYYIVHSLEDTILLPLIEAINLKKSVECITFGRDKLEKTIKCIPLKIYVSTQTGRRYLIYHHIESNTFKSVRLDSIRLVKILKSVSNYNDIYNRFIEKSQYCWGISFGNLKNTNLLESITFTIRINLPKEKYILDRLYRECRNGIVKKLSNGLYSCSIKTLDSNETKNWIRSFTGRIVSFECSNSGISKEFYNDIKRMYNMYGDD